MNKNEIKCWALQIVADSEEIRARIMGEIESNPYFVGIHIPDGETVLLLFSDLVERNKAYSRLNKGGEVIVALILPPCYVDKKYLKQN